MEIIYWTCGGIVITVKNTGRLLMAHMWFGEVW